MQEMATVDHITESKLIFSKESRLFFYISRHCLNQCNETARQFF